MKMKLFLASIMVMSIAVNYACAQSVGIAADKDKQANLEKIQKNQAELKKKYDAMTPEEQAVAKAKYDAYKKSGGKAKGNKQAKFEKKSNNATPTPKNTFQGKNANRTKPMVKSSEGVPTPPANKMDENNSKKISVKKAPASDKK